jgi:hypothetical protein
MRLATVAACGLALAGALAAVPAFATESSPTSPTPEPTATPTAVFSASTGWGVRLNLPADPSSLLAVGFHQASGRTVLKLTPVSACMRIQSPVRTRRMLGSMPGIKMFQQPLRGRGTSNFSAADCAVKPNSVILSPVSGTVTLVKNYRLYGLYRDVQLEIMPDNASRKLRVVVLHIQDPKVKVGDHLVGGVTPIATVRHFRFASTINRFLPVKYADHAHIQINRKK